MDKLNKQNQSWLDESVSEVFSNGKWIQVLTPKLAEAKLLEMQTEIDLANKHYHEMEDANKIMVKHIEELKEVACNYASIDGDHHKRWVINEMLKAVCSDSELEEMGFKDEDWLDECIAP